MWNNTNYWYFGSQTGISRVFYQHEKKARWDNEEESSRGQLIIEAETLHRKSIKSWQSRRVVVWDQSSIVNVMLGYMVSQFIN